MIHEAAVKALDAGTKLDDVLAICREVADRVPVVLMVYTNTILGGAGPEAFAAAKAAEAGACGVIVPDLPLGEDEKIRETMTAAGLAVVPLVAPTTLGEKSRDLPDRQRFRLCGLQCRHDRRTSRGALSPEGAWSKMWSRSRRFRWRSDSASDHPNMRRSWARRPTE